MDYNLQELLLLKQDFIDLNCELKKLRQKVKIKEKFLSEMQDKCPDTIIVKVNENNSNNKLISYYCMLCENKVSDNPEFINENGRYIVDFSNFTFDEGNLTIINKLEIVFEMYVKIKKTYPNISNEEVVRYINDAIKENDLDIQEKVMRKLFESISVFPKRKILV